MALTVWINLDTIAFTKNNSIFVTFNYTTFPLSFVIMLRAEWREFRSSRKTKNDERNDTRLNGKPYEAKLKINSTRVVWDDRVEKKQHIYKIRFVEYIIACSTEQSVERMKKKKRRNLDMEKSYSATNARSSLSRGLFKNISLNEMRKEKPSFVWIMENFPFSFLPNSHMHASRHPSSASFADLLIIFYVCSFLFNKVIDDLIFSLIVSPIQEGVALSPHTAENREEIFCIFYAISSSSTRRRELSWRSNVDDTLSVFSIESS